MKSFHLLASLMILFFIGQTGFVANGQEESKKIHLKIIKNGETVADTTFSQDELNEENLHEKIFELAGVDIDMETHEDGAMRMHKTRTAHVSTGESGTHSYVWVSEDEEGEGHGKKSKVIIKKGGDGDEECRTKFIINKDGDCDEKVFTVKSGDGKVKTYTITMDAEDEGDMDVHGHHEMEMHVSEGEDGMVFVSKEVEIEKMIEEGSDEVTIKVTIEEKKKEGTEKKEKKTKQKSKTERTKK